MPTLNDVARLAGVSSAVVSYVVNNGPRPVADATRARVLDAIDKLGYRPNAAARSLVLGRSAPAGLIVPDVRNPYFAALAQAVEVEARAKGVNLVLAQGAIAHELTLQRDPLDDKQYIYWEGQEKLQINNGGMAALLNVRDEVLPYHFDKLNEFASVFTETFNEMHRHGFGLDGETGRNFFAPLQTETTGVYKLTGNPQTMPPTNTYLMQAAVALDGDGTTAAVENYEGNPIGTGRLVINGFGIDYDGATDSLNDVVERINLAGAGVVAGVDPTGRLTLTEHEDADYTNSSLDDTGNMRDRLGLLMAGVQDHGAGKP